MPINSFLYPGPTNSNPYVVDNSCRFNDGDSAYLEKDFSTTQDSRRTFTVSAWVKRGVLGGSVNIWGSSEGSGEGYNSLKFESDDLQFLSGNTTNSGTQVNLVTNAKYRDPSAWLHVVLAVDSTDATEANRIKIYVNGTQVTSFSTSTYPSQNTDILTSTTPQMTIGMRDLRGTNAQFFDGYMAEVCFIDGLQLAPTSFGEFDADSPRIWKPKNLNPISGLKGTNGFYLDFEDSANLGNDVWGGTDFTETNLAATDQASDSPTNNFATMNPLDNEFFNATFSEGNLKLAQPSNTECYTTSTIAVSSSKWYWEVKITTSGSSKEFVGIVDKVADDSDFSPYSGNSQAISYYGSNGDSKAGSTSTNSSWGDTFTAGDIIGVALDLTNNKIYFSKNGTWQDSGDPTSGSTGTGALTVPASPADGVWYAQFSNIHNTASTFEINFGGCPAFAISSGNADDNGYGNFEYDVPSGYYALCTKNLAEFGG